jgi:hypothetical protein
LARAIVTFGRNRRTELAIVVVGDHPSDTANTADSEGNLQGAGWDWDRHAVCWICESSQLRYSSERAPKLTLLLWLLLLLLLCDYRRKEERNKIKAKLGHIYRPLDY